MNNFEQIVSSLGLADGGNTGIGSNPPLNVTYNQGGGGYTPSLIFELNQGVHITIYQSSWDDTFQITDFGGSDVTIGPYCLHTTAGDQRWFRQCDGTWAWVTDYGTPTDQYLNAFETMMSTMAEYLG